MTRLFIPKRYVSVGNSSADRSGVAAYRSTPENVHLQIVKKTDKQTRWTGIELTFDEAVQLANHLISEAQS